MVLLKYLKQCGKALNALQLDDNFDSYDAGSIYSLPFCVHRPDNNEINIQENYNYTNVIRKSKPAIF